MQRMPNAIQLTDLDDEELAARYAYPARLGQPWVRVNFVSSIDGAATSAGRTGGFGTPADKRVFGLLRELADVVLVGAGTVRAENYGGARTDEVFRRWLFEQGFGGHPTGTAPPIAVVTAFGALDPTGRLFAEATTPPLILTTAAASEERRKEFTAAGAEVIIAGEREITPHAVIDLLAARGLRRVLCEGGPRLFGQLLTADLVDELCLTTAPVLTGGTSMRISVSQVEFRMPMRLDDLIYDSDGTVLTRWVRS
ncbi:pyrimidine reductase family protein [Nocardia paucivorans]|uniref:pyrimidine reductase family protein n=1 Tax=Nocardia paucivorans TaxID=114259 RepID=UPI000313DD74